MDTGLSLILAWYIVIGLGIVLLGYLVYVLITQRHNARAWISLSAMGVIVLSLLVGLINAQTHSIDPLRDGRGFLFLEAIFLIQLILQWTNFKTMSRHQRTFFYISTGFVAVYTLVGLGGLIFDW